MKRNFKSAQEADKFYHEMSDLYWVESSFDKTTSEFIVVWNKKREFFKTEILADNYASMLRRLGFRKVVRQKSTLPSKPNDFMVTWCKKAKKK